MLVTANRSDAACASLRLAFASSPFGTSHCWCACACGRYDSQEEMHEAARAFVARYADTLVEDFGVAKELPCKLARGLYATKIHHGNAADDKYHHDICEADPHVFITVLSYPHANGWRAKWQGHTDFARVDCSVEPAPYTSRTPPALRVAPMPNRTVIFSGRIYHTTSTPSAKAGKLSRRSDPRASRSRYSVVLRLHCRRECGTWTQGGGWSPCVESEARRSGKARRKGKRRKRAAAQPE